MFKMGDIVAHTSNINKFYKVTKDFKNGQYEVEDVCPNFFDVYEKHVFMEIYLLSKSDRRNYAIDEIFKD